MKLSPKQKKNIIALYATGEYTLEALAKKYKVARNTIHKVIKSDKDFAQKVDDIKKEVEEEAVKSLAQFIEDHQKDGQSLIERLLDIPDELIAKTSIRDRVGASSLLLQMLTTKLNNTNSGKDALDELCSAIRSISDTGDASGE